MKKSLKFTIEDRLPVFNSIIVSKLLGIFLILFLSCSYIISAPSHDPSSMVRNVDGRYWIFTTGNGIWCMSSSNSNFTNWQGETAPFAGGYPSWINNYVSGFSNSFWAPDVIKIGSTYFLYYSCAGNGTAACIGLATATDLRGPWTDRGVVVYGNNAIDPAVYMDNGRLWMSWGNWVSGIDIIELSTSSGKPISGSTHLISGEVEGPGLIRNGNYYYLFYQRGLCCNGLNSTYYMVVARSTSITGPYSGERVFLPNRSGNQHGPGHFGYGEGKLTYHYYDVNNNGAATLGINTMGFSNGWPVAGITSGWESTSVTNSTINGTYNIVATHSGKALDVYAWGTSNGTNICQWSYWGGATQQFNIAPVDGEWHRITPVLATDKALDIEGVSTASGANLFIWSYWGGYGQQFRFQSAGSGVWRIIARHSDKCLDVAGASTADGANVQQWNCTSGSAWQMFSLNRVNSADLEVSQEMNIYPNPVTNGIMYLQIPVYGSETYIDINIVDMQGRTVYSSNVAAEERIELNTEIESGSYILQVIAPDKKYIKKILVQ